MRNSKAIKEKYLGLYGFFTLLIIPLISNPNLIDGISYFKLACSLLLISPIIPIIFHQLNLQSNGLKIAIFPIIWVCIISTSVIFGDQTYRNFFGAPGRNNGTLLILVFSYYFLFGIYIKKTNQSELLAKALFTISLLTSTFIIIFTLLNVENISIFSALNLKRLDFRDNVDFFGPLFCFGVISGWHLWRETKNHAYLFIIFPTFFISIWMQLLQIPVILLTAGVSILLIGKSKSNFNLKISAIGILFLYFIITKIIDYSNIYIDSSTIERLTILKFALKLKSEFTLIPQHIDGLSDFSANFSSNQVLDDFHNVYLQFAFSFGLIAGLVFLILTIWPVLNLKLESQQSSLIIPLNFSIIAGLLLGISSPNYIFLVAVILGYGVAKSHETKVNQYRSRELYLKFISVFLILTVLFACIIQVDDLFKRIQISNLTKNGNSISGNLFVESKDLLEKTVKFEDAEYKFIVASNYFRVGLCDHGELILRSMKHQNVREVRLPTLELAAKECRKLTN